MVSTIGFHTNFSLAREEIPTKTFTPIKLKDPVNKRFNTILQKNPFPQVFRTFQMVAIVSVITSLSLLSVTGVIPAVFFLAVKISLLATFSFLIGTIILAAVCKPRENKASPPPTGTYTKWSQSLTPFQVCKASIIEEVVFRSGLQGTLHLLLPVIVPATTLSLFGLQIPLAAALAILIAGTLFGAVHAFNGHQRAHIQAILAGISGIFVEGPLFYFFGFWASSLSHVIHNSIMHLPSEIDQAGAMILRKYKAHQNEKKLNIALEKLKHLNLKKDETEKLKSHLKPYYKIENGIRLALVNKFLKKIGRLKPAEMTPSDLKDDAPLAAKEAYEVIFENEKTRLLRIRIKPGQKVPPHTHPFRSVTLPLEGETDIRPKKSDPQKLQTLENNNKTSYIALQFELKC